MDTFIQILSSGLTLGAMYAISAVGLALVWPAFAHGYALDHLRTTDDIGPNKVPNAGVSHILVIPTRVGIEVFPRERLDAMRAFYDPAGGPGTFRGYWLEVSVGRYDPIPTLVDPVLYPDECPIPGKSIRNCRVELTDLELLADGSVQRLFAGLLERVRDEQEIDLSHFDVNTAAGPGHDGYFDGVIVDSDVLNGVAMPLNELGVIVAVSPLPQPPAPPRPDVGLDAGVADSGIADSEPDARVVDAGADAALPPDAALPSGPRIAMGNVAMVPPNNHEFGHLLGFIDLYEGPIINDEMGSPSRFRGGFISSTLSAFSRLQIGWGEVKVVEAPGVFDLAPVMDGGEVLRIGEPPRYLLVENRSGAAHARWDESPPGIYVYGIDEEQLPTRRLGFLSVSSRSGLYLPNESPPYLNVNVPLGCRLETTSSDRGCVMQSPGTARVLTHASGEETGWHIRLVDHVEGGIRVEIAEGSPPKPEPDAEPDTGPDDAGLDDGAIFTEAGPDHARRAGSSDGGCAFAVGRRIDGPVWLAVALAIALRRRRG